jgi:uncharacterized protein YegJ (DUF2314 family)
MPIRFTVAAIAAALLAASALPAFAETVAQKAKRDGVFTIAKRDAEMNAAFAKAQQSLGQFLDAFQAQTPGTGSFSVKIPISEGAKREYFWVNDLVRKGNQFTGRINNRPEVVQTVEYGQTISFPRSRISDWMYVDHGRMLGNFTTCVLLGREDPAQAQELMTQLGLSCEGREY